MTGNERWSVNALQRTWNDVVNSCDKLALTIQPHGLISDTVRELYDLGNRLIRLGDVLRAMPITHYALPSQATPPADADKLDD